VEVVVELVVPVVFKRDRDEDDLLLDLILPCDGDEDVAGLGELEKVVVAVEAGEADEYLGEWVCFLGDSYS